MKPKALRKIDLNHKRNLAQDNSDELDRLAAGFSYEQNSQEFWNPEQYSLLWGTPLWNQASSDERKVLNHLYWVAYYAQIISAEIATIFFNQTSAAALFSVDEFASTCRMLDLESLQERAHINAFRKIGLETENQIFGEPVFMYDMKLPYTETMIYQNSNLVKALVKNWLLKSFTLLSSSNVFIGCQYFTVRGLRTLNGKLVQHKLSQYYQNHSDKDNAPIPAKISYHHFLDESYHFNSSTIISQELIKLIPKPTAFEKFVVNQGVIGCQRDHYNFNSAVNGIFWYEPALFKDIYRILRSKAFAMNHGDAMEMMRLCFTEENQGMIKSQALHEEATDSYVAYVSELEFLNQKAKSMDIMKQSTLDKHLKSNRREFQIFEAKMGVKN